MGTAGPLALARELLDDGKGTPFFVLNRYSVCCAFVFVCLRRPSTAPRAQRHACRPAPSHAPNTHRIIITTTTTRLTATSRASTRSRRCLTTTSRARPRRRSSSPR